MLIDAHVHLFPERLALAVRTWFENHAWPVIYVDALAPLVTRLLEGGVTHMVALPYAHKPGMARAFNDFTAQLAKRHPQVVPCATVFPGEDDEEAILDEALGSLGCRGLKVHCHVMKLAADDRRFDPVWKAAARYDVPVVIHAGKEPAFEGYGADVRALSGAARMRRVLERFPDTKVIVPHLGANEFDAFEALLGEFPNLYLDTAMAIGRYLDARPDLQLLARHPERILYGSDYPNLPYEWTRELEVIRGMALPDEARQLILAGNAARLFKVQ